MSKNFFKPAIDGLFLFFKTERNAQIHIAIAVSVVIAGFVFGITRSEWLIIILCIGIVLVAEALNTAIEKLGNAITNDKNRLIKSAKDISAGAVLLAAITAAIIGGLIFLPYLF
ncbi:MAG: diacylglycerol kinase family protein [Prolixibacteraceae bacterium]|nr:diacylglycerol kinase family protein [Prolixibacteraceae bacterium]MBN2648801.1 diacylglycerol kinase family protein [Prolixibacteraceae bacterium]